MAQVKANDLIKVHYTGKLTDGEVFDSSVGREPLQFTVAAGQMIKGFDAAVHGMELNEKKTVIIPAAEAYGEYNDEMVQVVPKEHLPEGLNPEVGLQLSATSDNGHQIPVTIVEVNEADIKIDANHQLAGKDLEFEIEIVEIS
ncbi:MAG: peptidylprolyl isomerase [Flammeovirgaceae bacterium]|jgi:FKBP-type peptidyl-prolyl cis-trans isomerase 2|nr:peptidylprolyl isomerase [Flammeovirgaceae bacterium]|tara:strand:+ start:13594 stop:14022 length:429 start_codon:yes stop_codon:yes gene_type:complete